MITKIISSFDFQLQLQGQNIFLKKNNAVCISISVKQNQIKLKAYLIIISVFNLAINLYNRQLQEKGQMSHGPMNHLLIFLKDVKGVVYPCVFEKTSDTDRPPIPPILLT